MAEPIDLTVDLGRGLRLRSPVLVASGTFGYGKEFEGLTDLEALGGLVEAASELLSGGTYGFLNLAVEAFPDPTDPQVNVITLFPGQPTEEVERRVSIPLERALNGTPGRGGSS